MYQHLFKYSRRGLSTSFDGHVTELNEVNKWLHLLRAIDKVGLTSQPPYCFKCQVQNSELFAFLSPDLIIFNGVPKILIDKKKKQTEENKANSTNLYPLTKGYLRETCKSQNINPISLILSSPTVSFRS